MRLLMCLVVFAALSCLDFANTIWVPDDHPTIQAAIAGDGDEIIVRPGTYFENVDFIGKALSTQALHVGGVQPFALSNVQDLTLAY